MALGHRARECIRIGPRLPSSLSSQARTTLHLRMQLLSHPLICSSVALLFHWLVIFPPPQFILWAHLWPSRVQALRGGYCHDHANSIPIWTNSTLLLVYSNVPIPTPMFLLPTLTFLLPTPMFLVPTPTFLLLLQSLAFLFCSCHSFRYLPCFLLSPTCQSVTLLPTYPFHVFPPFM